MRCLLSRGSSIYSRLSPYDGVRRVCHEPANDFGSMPSAMHLAGAFDERATMVGRPFSDAAGSILVALLPQKADPAPVIHVIDEAQRGAGLTLFTRRWNKQGPAVEWIIDAAGHGEVRGSRPPRIRATAQLQGEAS